MTALTLALTGGLGVFYLYSAWVFGWTGLRPGPTTDVAPATRRGLSEWLIQAGLDDVDVPQFCTGLVVICATGAVAAHLVFGGPVPALAVGALSGSLPVAAYRSRRLRRLERAREAWPRMIEEIRILTGAAGRSVPQAVFEVGRRGPVEMRPAFEAAQREWLLTTDFELTLDTLKARLADPTVDVTCETLLIAHELGGTDLETRLEALADDRAGDTQRRKDAVARQAGARFARWFTVVVPAGMALVGMSIGDGRSAYAAFYGQVLVVIAVAMVAACWLAAGQIMRLPVSRRVFPECRSTPQ